MMKIMVMMKKRNSALWIEKMLRFVEGFKASDDDVKYNNIKK